MAEQEAVAVKAAVAGRGLTQAEVGRRLETFGENRLPVAHSPSFLKVLVLQFLSPLIYILMASAALSMLISEVTDALFIAVVLIINGLVGAVQEYSAGKSADALRALEQPHATVIRDGERRVIDAAGLVPGDLVLLESGERVPADIRLVQANGLQCDEAAHTGESRAVAKEDRAYLGESGLHFNAHTLMGGKLAKDASHKLFLIYPEGNWVEISQGTPYHIIGEGGYGKPVLDRTLKYGDPIRFALKVGCLAFDSTRISASDVDFPVDVVLYYREFNQLVQHRYEADDLRDISHWWQERLRQSVRELPSEWIDNIASKLTTVGSACKITDQCGPPPK